MSFSSKITDDEMRFFQFKARQFYLLRKEDHEWNEFCKKNTCTCCSCQTSIVPKDNKEVGVQSSTKTNLPTSAKSNGTTFYPNKKLPRILNEIKLKLEKLDLALYDMNTINKMKEETKPKEMLYRQANTLTFPTGSDMAESVKSIINDRRMQLIQDSLKMSVQRLQSAALRNLKPNSNIKVKKKDRGYFIPWDLEKKRAVARQAYLASLRKSTVQSNVLLHSTRRKIDAKGENLKPKLAKTVTKSNLRKFQKVNNQKEQEPFVESNQLAETKDENIETAIDAIMEDIFGETVLVINKIKQSKSEKSSTVMQNVEHVPSDNVHPRNISLDLDSKKSKIEIGQFENRLETIRKNLICARKRTDPNCNKLEPIEIEASKNATESEYPSSLDVGSVIHPKDVGEIKNIQPLKIISIDPIKAGEISKCRKEYWSYLERLSRTKKGNFDPWVLSNLVAESLLDDCLQEIAEELQDIPASFIANLYDQEFFQTI